MPSRDRVREEMLDLWPLSLEEASTFLHDYLFCGYSDGCGFAWLHKNPQEPKVCPNCGQRWVYWLVNFINKAQEKSPG